MCKPSLGHPQLCLLQLATPEETVIVDPFKISDLKALRALFRCEDVVKLFHAGRQDLEILFHEVGEMPHPIFDTQVAAAVLGYSQQIGYAALVNAECGVPLKKGDSYTDWTRRPLSSSQLRYAIDDVRYLPCVYESMKQRLDSLGRSSWLDEDFASLIDPAKYRSEPRERYLRLKRASSLSGRALSAARELAAWREETAMQRNLPRKWIMTDEQVVEACRRETTSIDGLFLIRGIQEKLSYKDAREVIAAISRGLAQPKDQWPQLSPPSRRELNVDIPLDLMSALVRLRAKENDIASQTLASHDDLVHLARGHTKGLALLKGWRRKLIGNELLALCKGQICLSLEDGNLMVKDRSCCAAKSPRELSRHDASNTH